MFLFNFEYVLRNFEKLREYRGDWCGVRWENCISNTGVSDSVKSRKIQSIGQVQNLNKMTGIRIMHALRSAPLVYAVVQGR